MLTKKNQKFQNGEPYFFKSDICRKYGLDRGDIIEKTKKEEIYPYLIKYDSDNENFKLNMLRFMVKNQEEEKKVKHFLNKTKKEYLKELEKEILNELDEEDKLLEVEVAIWDQKRKGYFYETIAEFPKEDIAKAIAFADKSKFNDYITINGTVIKTNFNRNLWTGEKLYPYDE